MEPLACLIPAGTVIGEKYVVVRELGSGGVGVVVEAVHRELDERVAIKVMLPSAMRGADDRERFLREARAAVKLKSEHVARVLDVGAMPDGLPYIVMEYLEGSELSEVLRLQGQIPVPVAVDTVLQVCVGLAEAHGRGIVHRDIKPSNLFLTQRVDGTPLVKILDFGIAKTDLHASDSGRDLTKTRTMLGSPAYMSPEQIRSSRSVDVRTDVWSIGVLLHQALTGELPFAGETVHEVMVSIIEDQPTSLRERRPDLPSGLIDAVDRCLAKDREQRHADVAHLAQALLPFAPADTRITATGIASTLGISLRRAGGGSTSKGGGRLADAETVLDTGPAQRAASWRRWAVLSGVLAALVLVGIGMSLTRPSPGAPQRPGAGPAEGAALPAGSVLLPAPLVVAPASVSPPVTGPGPELASAPSGAASTGSVLGAPSAAPRLRTSVGRVPPPARTSRPVDDVLDETVDSRL